jgi:hypothetical protein
MRFLTIAIMLLLLSPVYGQFLDGYRVYDNWKNYKRHQSDHSEYQGMEEINRVSIQGAWFMSYVLGVVDASHDCIPEIELDQLWLVVGKYLEEHPERLSLRGEIIVMEAINEAFPCEP